MRPVGPPAGTSCASCPVRIQHAAGRRACLGYVGSVCVFGRDIATSYLQTGLASGVWTGTPPPPLPLRHLWGFEPCSQVRGKRQRQEGPPRLGMSQGSVMGPARTGQTGVFRHERLTISRPFTLPGGHPNPA